MKTKQKWYWYLLCPFTFAGPVTLVLWMGIILILLGSFGLIQCKTHKQTITVIITQTTAQTSLNCSFLMSTVFEDNKSMAIWDGKSNRYKDSCMYSVTMIYMPGDILPPPPPSN
jgi:hypothetical protein